MEWRGKTLVRFSERKDEKTTAQRVGELLGSHAYSGIAGFNKALAQTADFFLPDEWLGESNAVSALFDDYRRRGDDAAEQAARVREGFGSAGRIAGNVTEATVQALPGALLALLTAGGSAAAQTTSGLQAATTAAASSGLVQTLSPSMQTMLKNPMFWLAFSQSAGKNYEEAKARGAGELSAQTSAILSSLLTSGVEIGGGLETLPAELIDGASVPTVQKWVRSMLEEGREEVVQGVVEQLTAKLLYDADKPYLSASDLDAVLNPLRSAQEFGIGAAVGGILGGGQLGAATLINRTQADAPLLDYIRGFQESGDLDGAGRHMQNKSAVGLDLASAEVKAAALDTPLTQSLSSGEISRRITNLLGALEEADTAIAVRPNGITDTQLSLLLDRLYDATSLKSQFPGALSRSLKEVEDGLLDFRIAREWDTASDGGYSTAAQRKAWGVLMRRLSSGPLPDLVKWIDNGGNTAEQYSLLEQVGPVGYDSFGQAKDTQTDSQIESIWDGYEQKNSPLTEGAGNAGKIPWDSWQGYEKVTQNGKTYAKVGDRMYSEHAVNRMQPSGNRFGINIYEGLNGEDYGRSIAPQYVEDVINSAKPVFQPRTGNYSYALGNVEVIVNPQGAVVTILTYK
ncbi:hypothetical protein SDC9_83345 [bioreactor metagenome]|uniref:Uncharacterized protein n=1 Tax=bioreactor metagenome TaxID=1076179 RepID=A0A644ZDF8_9ZZZZ